MTRGHVDAHFHIFAAHEGVPGSRYIPTYDATLDAWTAAAQACGVTQGVLVQPSFLGSDHGRLLAALQAHPGRLRGVAVVEPDESAARLRELHAAGVRAIRLNLVGRLASFEKWRHADALWRVLEALGWHVEIYTGVGELPQVLPHLPRTLTLVIDHLGRPESVAHSDPTIDAVLRRAASGRVYIKVTGAYRLEGRPAPEIARLWARHLGVDRLLWGSDWPCTNHEALANYAALLAQAGAWLGPEAVEAVAGGNARRLYWRDESR